MPLPPAAGDGEDEGGARDEETLPCTGPGFPNGFGKETFLEGVYRRTPKYHMKHK